MKSNPAKTVLTISIGFIIIYLATNRHWAITASVLLGLVGIFSDFLSRKIEFLWMKLAWLLGLVMPVIILSIVFYLFLFPVAMLSKLFGNKNALQLKNSLSSTYKSNKRQFDKASMENPW